MLITSTSKSGLIKASISEKGKCLELAKKQSTKVKDCQFPSLVLFYNFSTNTPEPTSRYVCNCDVRIQILLSILFYVPLSGNPNPHALGHVPDSTTPQMLVQLYINAHICGSHHLLSKLLYFFYSLRSLLLERAAMEALVQVDGVLARDDFVLAALALLHHCSYPCLQTPSSLEQM
eukprot:c2545_g1_i1 orf=106-633(+)